MVRRDSNKHGTATLKLISLALALMLEFYFYSQDNSITRRISAVVEIQNVPDSRLIVEPADADKGIPAHIDVRGPRTLVDQLAMTLHKVRANYPENEETSFPLVVNYQSLILPPRVSVVSAIPKTISIRTVELVRKEVPIIMPTTGLVKSGFKLEKIVLSPERLIIRGPLEEVQKIKNIQLQEIDLSGIGESTRLERRIEQLAPNTTPSINLVEVDLVVIPAIEAVEQFNGVGADVSGQVVVPIAKQSPKSVKLGTQTKN